jgi:CBS domain-containing protein
MSRRTGGASWRPPSRCTSRPTRWCSSRLRGRHAPATVRQGGVSGEQRLGAPGPFAIEAGELFPVSAVLGGRAVTATYKASGDTFCLRVPAAVRAPGGRQRALCRLRQPPHAAAAGAVAARAARPLCDRARWPSSRWRRRWRDSCDARRSRCRCRRSHAAGQALQAMHDRSAWARCWSPTPDGAALGILTRHDMLDRVVLPRREPGRAGRRGDERAGAHARRAQRAHDAALLMSREGVRHVPITDGGRVVGIVSERDLFALQRLSLRQLGAPSTGADSVATLQEAAADIRRFASPAAGAGRAGAAADRAHQPPQRPPGRALLHAAGGAARAGPDAGLLAGLRLRGPRRADHRHRPGQRPHPPRRPGGLAGAGRGRQPGAGRLRLPAVPGRRDGRPPEPAA